MTRRRFLLIAVTLLGAASGYWWWWNRLTADERLLVGRWVCHEAYPDGSTCERTWDVTPDRTARFHNQYHFVATAERAARDEVMEGKLFWSYRGGRLVVVLEHPPLEQVQVFAWMAEREIQNLIQGKQEIVMDPYSSNGRLSHFDQNSFTVHWWNPDKKAESPLMTFKAVRDPR